MKIIDIKAFPIRVSDKFDLGRKIDTRNLNTAMLATRDDSRSSRAPKKDYDQSGRKLQQGPEIKDMGTYYIDESSNTSIYSKFHETTVVRVETENGIVGWGESQSPVSPNTTCTIIKDIVTPLTIGRNIYDVEAIWHRNYTAKRERGHYTGFYIDAISGIDIAIWDAIGKSMRMPTCQAMGGVFREKVDLYNGIGGNNPKEVAEQAKWSVSKGYKFVKIHLKEDLETTVEIVSKAREAVGKSIGIMLDVHMMFDTFNAIKLGRHLERLNVIWIESPSDPTDIPGQCEISRALDIPVANGEWTRTKYEMREIFEKRAYDISMPDIARTGLTGGKQIATIAELYNIPIAPHVGGGGILSIAATLQFSLGIPNFMIMEHSEQGHSVKAMILSEKFEPQNAQFKIPKKAGLGIEIDENKLEEFKIAPSL